MLASTILSLLEENIQNMHSFVYANMLPQELANQFDRVANKFVDAALKPSMAGTLVGVDEIQVNIDSLRNLKVNTTLTPTIIVGTTDYQITLPTNYRNLLNDVVKVTNTCGTINYLNVPTREIGDEVWETTKQNPFAKPLPRSPISKILTNKFIINAGGSPVTEATITYLRKLTALDATGVADYTEFPEEILLQIIDLTRNRVLEIIQGERLPTSVQETGNFGTM